MKYLIHTGFFLVLLGYFSPTHAADAPAATPCESAWASAEQIQARLICATDDKGALTAGLEIRLSPGWHTYWRTPGDSGLPPTLKWEGSQNLASATLLWPAPSRIDIMGLQSFGYHDHILFPLDIAAEKQDQPLTLNLAAEFMVCNDICIPQSLKLSLPLKKDETYSRLLAKARETLPQTAESPAINIKNVVLGPGALVVSAWSQEGFSHADLFAEAPDVVLTAKPEITPDEKDPRNALIRIAKPEGTDNLATVLSGKTLTLTLTTGSRAFEKKIAF